MSRNRWWLPCLLAGLATMPAALQAQQSGVPDWFLRLRLPNAAAKSILTPAAWGTAYGVAFAGAGSRTVRRTSTPRMEFCRWAWGSVTPFSPSAYR